MSWGAVVILTAQQVTRILLHIMGLFDEKLTRLTVSITPDQRRELVELAARAGGNVPLARVVRAALTAGLKAVRAELDRETEATR